MTPEWKLIFTVLIQHRSREEFIKSEKDAEDKYIRETYREVRDTQGDDVVDSRIEEQARRGFRSSRPILYRFNDLVGFAEVYWDRGTRIMVDFYFRGDGRTRYGHRIQSRSSSGVSRELFYAYAPMVEVAWIHRGDSVEARRQAISRALDHVEETAQEVLCFADTSAERAVLQSLDVDTFLA